MSGPSLYGDFDSNPFGLMVTTCGSPFRQLRKGLSERCNVDLRAGIEICHATHHDLSFFRPRPCLRGENGISERNHWFLSSRRCRLPPQRFQAVYRWQNRNGVGPNKPIDILQRFSARVLGDKKLHWKAC